MSLLKRRHRELKFTRDGKWFVFLVFGVGFAAINTGNNLLYLILGMMLSLIVASGILSESSLQRLSVSRRLPPRVFAGSAALITIVIHNKKKRAPAFSVEGEETATGSDTKQPKRCYYLKIPAKAKQTAAYQHTFAHRGAFKFGRFNLVTRFPFHLFEKRAIKHIEEELIVYPQLAAVSPAETTTLEAGLQRGTRVGRWGDFYGLREYRHGDDPRDVSWRKSATRGTLVVKQHEDPRRKSVRMFFNNCGQIDDQAQEHAISRVAALVVHLLKQDYKVGLTSHSFDIPAHGGEAQIDRILTALALMRYEDQPKHTAPVGNDWLLIDANGRWHRTAARQAS